MSKKVFFLNFLPVDLQLLQYHLLIMTVFAPLYCFYCFVKNHLAICIWVYFGVSIIFKWSIRQNSIMALKQPSKILVTSAPWSYSCLKECSCKCVFKATLQLCHSLPSLHLKICWSSLKLWSLMILAPGTGFVENNFSIDWSERDGFGMILISSTQSRSLPCADHSSVPTPVGV